MQSRNATLAASADRGTKKPFSIANSVKPSKAQITLPGAPGILHPTFEQIEALQAQVANLRQEKLALEREHASALKHLREARRIIAGLRTRFAKFLTDETAGIT